MLPADLSELDQVNFINLEYCDPRWRRQAQPCASPPRAQPQWPEIWADEIHLMYGMRRSSNQCSYKYTQFAQTGSAPTA
jgi:hypothetical protein